jgi:hypothetical protein
MPVDTSSYEINQTVDLQNEAAIKRATAELQRRGRNADHYKISILGEGEILTVLFEAPDAPEPVLGSGGSVPGFAVEFEASTMRMLKSYFVR